MCNASINVKPEGGGPRAYVGHLTSIAFPTLGNLTKNLGPRVGTFAFFCTEEWDMVYSLHCLCKTETIAFDFITLNARFVDCFNRITQSIKKLGNLHK